MTAARSKSSKPSGVAAVIPTLARKAPIVAPTTPPGDKSNRLDIAEQPGKTHDRLLSDVVAQGLVVNASTAMRFVKPAFGELSLTDMVASLRESGEAINRNDMASAERMLYAQAVALNAMFGELARVAHCNLFKNPEVADRYMRLSLRAQNQSRATVETLAAMKNPPVVFTRQANFANGQQQVNNGVTNGPREGARAGETQPEPNKLLEANDVERLDTGAKGSAGGADPQMATLGAVNGTAKRRREGRRRR
jgi:hypothetical protein